MKVTFRHVVEDMDRHGNVRIYYRRKGQPKVRLRGPIGSPEFIEDYRAAVDGTLKTAPQKTAIQKGTIRWLCIEYYKSPMFSRQLDPSTQRVRRRILDAMCMKEGDKPVKLLRPSHVRTRRDAMADRPQAANGMLKALRQLLKFGVEYEHLEDNVAAKVPYIAVTSDGFHAWTVDEVKKYEDKHPIGTQARLALALLLYTGQRREDVIHFGRQHMRDGWLKFRQHKNRNRKPVDLEIPIIAELQKVIDATDCGDLAFLKTEYGRPFASGTSFYNRFKKWCVAAGIPHCSPHGLRKAAAARLGELGCSELEIMSVTGHKTMAEVVRYTRSARQKVMAQAALGRLSEAHDGNKSVPLLPSNSESGTKEA